MNSYLRQFAPGLSLFVILAGFVLTAKADTIAVNGARASTGMQAPPAVSPGPATVTLENHIVEVPVEGTAPRKPAADPNDAEKKIPFLRRLHTDPPERVFKMDR